MHVRPFRRHRKPLGPTHWPALVAGLVAVVSMVATWATPAAADPSDTLAVGGQLDLTTWLPGREGPKRLDGEWRFVPGELLGPDASSADFGSALATVPDSFGEHPHLRDGRGVATYSLEVALPTQPGTLGLRLSTVGTAYRLYADGVLIAEAGKVGASAADSEAAYQPKLVELSDGTAGTLRLVLQVSNHHYAKGGFWEPFWIGPPEELRADREGRVGLSMFLAGAFLLLGLYHLTAWAVRPQDRSPLFFAILCLGMAVRGLSVDDVYLMELVPSLDWNTMVRIEYLSMLVALTFTALFMGSLFPKELPPALIFPYAACCGVAMAAVLLLPVDVFSRGLPAMQLLVLFAAVVGPALTALAWKRQRDGALLFFVGLVAISSTAVHDILISNYRSLPTIDVFGGRLYLQSFGQVIFALCQAAMLAQRAAHNTTALERTGAELRSARDELEERVAERTAKLEQANRTLQRLAEDDGLTRLANRRRFDEEFEQAWQDHARRGAPLALVMADIDCFKHYNDRYGHPAGDAALRRVAQSSAACARGPLDLVARYGGEELVTLLADTDLAGAFQLAERQRRAVVGLAIPHEDNDHQMVTLSLGVAACIPVEGESPESLLERADNALYEAKRMGRNQVVASDETE